MRAQWIVLIIVLCWANLALSSPEQQKQEPYFRLKPMQRLKMENIERQTRDYSCGAAALNMLLHSYFDDKAFTEAALLKEIILRLPPEEMNSRIADGFTMLDLKRLSLRLGYAADGVIMPREAVSHLKGPVIILVSKNGIKHFVILKGAANGRAFIADPLAGNYRVPLHELFAQWQGETLIVGREGFGLPQKHTFSLPTANNAAPEGDAARVLRHTRFMRIQNP